MSDRRDIVYLYDGSFDGLLCAVFECFKNHEIPISIEENKNVQQIFYCDYKIIKTDFEKSERVSSAITKKISKIAWYNIYFVYLSDETNKGRLCLDYIRAGFHLGNKIDMYLNWESVSSVLNTARRIKNEAHQYLQFIRFSELEGGIYYSEIEPRCNILPIISRHFQSRLPTIPWIIHDICRHLCTVYNGKSCYITTTDSIPSKKYAENEKEYKTLWKEFYHTIEIKERKNDYCRMTHMPKRYWNHITEFEI